MSPGWPDARYPTVGRIVAAAWSDGGFRERLARDPETALSEHGVATAGGERVEVRLDTGTRIHLVLCAPPAARAPSAGSEVRAFGETYREPPLWSLNWRGRDPVATARFLADPRAELAKIGVAPPNGLEVVGLLNTGDRAWLVCPAAPEDRLVTPALLARLREGIVPGALRTGALLGAGARERVIARLGAPPGGPAEGGR